MNPNQILGRVARFLRYCLIACLSFSTLMFLFVFIINWEDRFFGIKLDGLPAGLYLLAKWVIAVALAAALVRHPRYALHLAAAAVCYYGWLLLDSSITIQHLANGPGRPSPMIVLFAIVALACLATHICIHLGRSGQ